MISNYYPAPVSDIPSSGVYQQPTNVAAGQVSYFPTAELARAKARNLDVIEYRRRVALVANELRDCHYQLGDTVFPAQAGPAKKYGKCIIKGIIKHYDDYGDIEWNEPPFLVYAQSLEHKDETISCSVGYLTKKEIESVC